MSLRTITWSTPVFITCAGQILCGSSTTMPVVLCLLDGKSLDGPSGIPKNTILAALTKVLSAPVTCGNSPTYQYTFSYDDVQTGGYALAIADITGVVCDECTVGYMRDYNRQYSLSGLLSDTGSQTTLAIVATGTTALPNLALEISLTNDPDVFGGRDLLLQTQLRLSIGFGIYAYTQFQFERRITVDGVVGAWQDIFFHEPIAPVGAHYQLREIRTNIELAGPLTPIKTDLASGATTLVHVDFQLIVATLAVEGATLYGTVADLFLYHWAK